MVADPIDNHVAALAGALRGPRRVRRSMIAEARSGLRDAEEAYRDAGVAPRAAAALAVRDFGGVHEVAPSFQEELAARRGRWSAVVLAVVFPGMLVGWDLLWRSGAVRTLDRVETGAGVPALASALDAVTVAVAVAAVALFAVTFHRRVSPLPVVRAVGLTGAAGVVLCGGLAVALNVAGGASALASPPVLATFTASALVLALTGWQSVRTLRVSSAARPPAPPSR